MLSHSFRSAWRFLALILALAFVSVPASAQTSRTNTTGYTSFDRFTLDDFGQDRAPTIFGASIVEDVHMASNRTAAQTAKKVSDDPFFQGAEERAQASRWTHDDKSEGSSILGRFIGTRAITYGDGKTGEAAVFSPALERTANGELKVHRVIETIYSAVLAMKITTATDKGAVFAIRYDGKAKSDHKGRSDFKVFTVATQSPDVLAKKLQEEGANDLAALVRNAE